MEECPGRPAGRALRLLSSKVGGQGRGLPDPPSALLMEGRAGGEASQLWQPVDKGESAGKRGGMGARPQIEGSGPSATAPRLEGRGRPRLGDPTQRRGLPSRRAAPSDRGLGRQNWQGEGAFLRQRRPSV